MAKSLRKSGRRRGARCWAWPPIRTCWALLAVEDTLKPGAAEVMKQLQRDGLETYLVTGDNPLTAQAIAQAGGHSSEKCFCGSAAGGEGAVHPGLAEAGSARGVRGRWHQ